MSKSKSFRNAGFTLLELLLSCAILVSVFSIAAAVLTRVHRVRSDAESQTKLMTRGRAILDSLANDIANSTGTNGLSFQSIENGSAAGDGPGDSSSSLMEFIQYTPYPQKGEAGSAYTNVPYMRTLLAEQYYEASSVAESELQYEDDGETLVYSTRPSGSAHTVTNAFAGEEMGSHVMSAGKGDTISLPITSSSSRKLYGTSESANGWFEIVPSEYDGTNIINASVVFTNTFSRTTTYTVRRPVAGSWPEGAESSADFSQTFTCEASGTEATNTPLRALSMAYPDYRNILEPIIVVTTNEIVQIETNTVAEIDLPAEIVTNIVTVVETNTVAFTDIPGGAFTNETVAVSTNTTAATALASALVLSRTENGEMLLLSQTNTVVEGRAAFSPSSSVRCATNYWSWGGEAIKTNNIISGMTIIAGGKTNTFATAEEVAQNVAKATVIDGYEYSSSLNDSFALSISTNGPTSLSDFDLVQPTVSFSNSFYKYDKTGKLIPLILWYSPSLRETDYADRVGLNFSYGAHAVGASTNRTPIVAENVRRSLTYSTHSAVTDTNIVITVDQRCDVTAEFLLSTEVPSSIIETNRYDYSSSRTNVYETGTAYDSETTWRDIVLDEDFPGADDRTVGVWLKEENGRTPTELVATTNVRQRISMPKNETTSEHALAHHAIAYRLIVTPLTFGTNETTRLDLREWTEGDPPPVCVDLYLEMLSREDEIRARKLTGDKKGDFIRQRLVRLARRVPFATTRRTLP